MNVCFHRFTQMNNDFKIKKNVSQLNLMIKNFILMSLVRINVHPNTKTEF